MKPILELSNIGKEYTIGAESKRYLSLRDQLVGGIKSTLSRTKGNKAKNKFWALKDVSFDVYPGECLGIIGRNGAGKSTLLKVLSKITPPTTGKIISRGRVASLLEVGTGFHPELNGRENVFLNGSILGLSRKEINQQFDAIVDFSGVEKFIDTPLKHYSSGMQLRLAFAVAAHLQPEILVIDEVLAVGDAEFQKKCLGKMDEVSKSGRTILFVSHNMGAIQNLCTKCVILKEGKLIDHTDTKSALTTYLKHNQGESNNRTIAEGKNRKGTGLIRFTNLEISNIDTGEIVNAVLSGMNVKFRFYFENASKEILYNVALSIGLNDKFDQRISFLSTDMVNETIESLQPNQNHIDLILPKVPLVAGFYSLTLYCTVNGVVADWIQGAFTFEIDQGDFFGTGKKLPNNNGQLLIDHSFTV